METYKCCFSVLPGLRSETISVNSLRKQLKFGKSVMDDDFAAFSAKIQLSGFFSVNKQDFDLQDKTRQQSKITFEIMKNRNHLIISSW